MTFIHEAMEKLEYKPRDLGAQVTVVGGQMPGSGSLLTAENFLLIIDGKVVNNHIKKFPDVLAALFALYSYFNFHYPPAAAATLEFIQRCLIHINPGKGSKVAVQKNKRSYTMNPKVLSFINGLADFEWAEMA